VGDGPTLALQGASITQGVPSPVPVVNGSDPPYNRPKCDAPAPAGTFAGRIVVCQRGGNPRVDKGYNVLRGGAAGMLLYNPTPQDVETDNHWLPTIHLDAAAGKRLLAFLAANHGASASFPEARKTDEKADVVAAFSSRGPGGDWLKPDVTAPGVEILAGHTPVTESPVEGPPGQYFQAIAGTSMSSPEVAGAAALLRAVHPEWTPGQVKSALETTAVTSLVKQDKVTPADPFDIGGGRIDLTRAGDPGLTFDVGSDSFSAAAADALDRIDLNLPSINAPLMPGEISTTRTATNVSNRTLVYRAESTAPKGATITVTPKSFVVPPGATVSFSVVISAPTLAVGQYFGRVDLRESVPAQSVHLPVAFQRKQGEVTLTQRCTPMNVTLGGGGATCTATAQNSATSVAEVSATSTVGGALQAVAARGATLRPDGTVATASSLAARIPDAPRVAPGSLRGYVPLPENSFAAVRDEEALNFTGLRPFEFAGKTYTSLGAVSNGYLVAGGVSKAVDIQAVPHKLPTAAAPNGVLAPFWSDLDGTGAPGIGVSLAEDAAGKSWLVVEWRVYAFGTQSPRAFQVWLGLNGAEDITFAYDPASLPQGPTTGGNLTVGAENAEGSAGGQIDGPPTKDLRVTTTPGKAGGSLTYSYEVKGTAPGTGTARTDLRASLVRGVTTVVDTLTVR
jgi:hypothetical protein